MLTAFDCNQWEELTILERKLFYGEAGIRLIWDLCEISDE